MPQVIAYKGTIAITGNSRNHDEDIYDVKRSVYAESIGALLDAMVEETIRMTTDVKSFVRTTMPTGYKLDDGYWFFHVSYPRILDSNEVGVNHDDGAGSASSSALDMIRTMAHYRSMAFSHAVSQLNATRREMELQAFNNNSEGFSSSYSTKDVNLITTTGMLGHELDAILMEAMLDGSYAKYQKNQKNMRHYREIERLNRVRNADRKSKIEEKKPSKPRRLVSFWR